MAEDKNTGEEELEELEELMDDIEIEDELHQEEKVRKKNAKVLLISIVGLLTIAVVYFGINYFNARNEEEQLLEQPESPQSDQLDIETLSLQDDLKTIGKKEGVLIEKEVEEKDKNKPLPQKKSIEKKESADLEVTKKKRVKEKTPPPKKIKKTDRTGKQIEEKAPESLPLPSGVLKKSSVEKKSKPAAPSPQKTAKILVPETSESGRYYIQFGQFVIKKNADNLIRSLKNKGFSPSNTLVKNEVNMYRVYAGKFSELKMAREAIIDLENKGINATLKSVTDNFYALQTGSFYLKRNAEKLKDEIAELGLVARIVRAPLTMDVNKVYIGFFKTRKEAALYQQELSVQGFSETLILDS